MSKQQYPSNPELRAITVKLLAQGWRVERTTNGYMAYPPDRTLSGVSFHDTPSDVRAIRNTRALLRQRGAKL